MKLVTRLRLGMARLRVARTSGTAEERVVAHLKLCPGATVHDMIPLLGLPEMKVYFALNSLFLNHKIRVDERDNLFRNYLR